MRSFYGGKDLIKTVLDPLGLFTQPDIPEAQGIDPDKAKAEEDDARLEAARKARKAGDERGGIGKNLLAGGTTSAGAPTAGSTNLLGF